MHIQVWSLDAEMLACAEMVPSPAYAVLVCFPLTAEYRKAAGIAAVSGDGTGPYFMRQTVPNACGTVALVHAFAALPLEMQQLAVKTDSPHSDWLGSFVAKTQAQDAMQRAAALEDDEALSASHNTMAAQGDTNVEAFQAPGAADNDYKAVMHFVAYVRSSVSLTHMLMCRVRTWLCAVFRMTNCLSAFCSP